MPIDFKGLNDFIKPRVLELLAEWLPGGKMNGREYQCGDKRGGPGSSLRYNVDKLTGSDFATGETFGDIIDLFSKVRGVSMADAARDLTQRYGYTENPPSPSLPAPKIATPSPASEGFQHFKHGLPSKVYNYSDIFKVARYETAQGKQFAPWILINGKWEMRAPDKPRPLYNREDIFARVQAPVLIVEGEKAADAAREFTGGVYVVTTWPNGASAVRAADWSVLSGRSVLVWPDADAPGRVAGAVLCEILSPLCFEIKVINTDGQPDGWDAADSGFSWQSFREWAAPRVSVYGPVKVPVVKVDIQNTGDEPVTKGSLYALWERLGLVMTNAGAVVLNMDNMVRIFERDNVFERKIWFDEFHLSVFTEQAGVAVKLTDQDILSLTLRMQRYYGLSRMNVQTVRDAVAVYARADVRHEPKDWMSALVWDEAPRVEQFMYTYLGCEDTEYVRAVSKNFWVSMIARVMDPGCIMRTMVVFKGKQWTGKSTVFATIGGKWYTEILENIHTNNFLQSLRGHFIMEFADLAGFVRADINRIKQIISCRKDTYRAPYDREPCTHLRQCVFVATTNEDDFLRDDTGNSRFWPVEPKRIDIDAIMGDREQLFAEAVALYKAGAGWHVMPEVETTAAQERYRNTDEWEAIIGEYVQNKFEVTVREVGVSCLRIEQGKLDKAIQMRIARNLTVLGWRKNIVRRGTGTVRVWEAPAGVVTEQPQPEQVLFTPQENNTTSTNEW